MNDTSFVSELKTRADIYDVVSDSVQLKKSGANWSGLCPFHAEKTPSFSVNTSKQIFHCFGCGTGGDVISFVMKLEGVSFREALEVLASRYGMQVPRHNPKKAELRDRLLHILSEAEGFFRKNLGSDPAARAYLASRGIDGNIAETFAIGSAPNEWRSLSAHLQSRGHSRELMVQAGLAVRNEKGNHYDAFRGRIIIPIRNLYGKTVAFGGRILSEDQQPKYLNSPQSPVYNKSEILYGLDMAKDHIRTEGLAIVTEGYMDALACHQFGFNNAVATLGTALTPGHARLLKRFTDIVVLIFDGDEAGLRASRKALPLLLCAGVEPRVLVLPDGMDPDSCLRRKGPGEFRELLRTAPPLVDFLISAVIGDSGRTSASRTSEALAITAEIPNGILRGQTLKLLAERLGIQERYLSEELDRIMSSRRGSSEGGRRPGSDSAEKPANRSMAEELLLSSALEDRGMALRLVQELSADDFQDVSLRPIFVRLEQFINDERAWEMDAIMSGLQDSESRSAFTRLMMQSPSDAGVRERVFRDALESITKKRIISRQGSLRRRINEGSREAMEIFLEEQRRLKNRRNPDR